MRYDSEAPEDDFCPSFHHQLGQCIAGSKDCLKGRVRSDPDQQLVPIPQQTGAESSKVSKYLESNPAFKIRSVAYGLVWLARASVEFTLAAIMFSFEEVFQNTFGRCWGLYEMFLYQKENEKNDLRGRIVVLKKLVVGYLY
ncbi:hypothetical protein RF11_00486 [Thelohanellus kitauei]|uniref:Uncharacterized protein n=1 Tax=Thelohanellus kitauei TaxID=669202 RepID=A0A0C2MMY0_THEKT|nr:hypothetical protein RF11_00486 [Thelohanellus kitauei]